VTAPGRPIACPGGCGSTLIVLVRDGYWRFSNRGRSVTFWGRIRTVDCDRCPRVVTGEEVEPIDMTA